MPITAAIVTLHTPLGETVSPANRALLDRHIARKRATVTPRRCTAGRSEEATMTPRRCMARRRFLISNLQKGFFSLSVNFPIFSADLPFLAI